MNAIYRLALRALALTLLMSIEGTSHAQSSLLDEDFESQPVGMPPAFPWTVEGVAVTVSQGHDAQSPFDGHDHVRGARVRDLVGANIPALEYSFLGKNFPLTVSFDYMYVEQTGNPQLTLSEGNMSGIRMVLTDVDGHPSVKSAKDFHVVQTIKLLPRQWYRFMLTIAADSRETFSLKVVSMDGSEQAQDNLPFEKPLLGFSEIRFSFNTVPSVLGGEYFIDNVKVSSTP